MNRSRSVALILSASAASWLLLGLEVAPRLHLHAITVAAAAVMVAVQAGALLYACLLAPAPHPRGLDHLDYLSRLCTVLGLLGTVGGIIAEFRSLHGIHGGLDPTQALDFVGRMAFGFGTAMVSTFVGILCMETVRLAEHVLAPERR